MTASLLEVTNKTLQLTFKVGECLGKARHFVV